MPGPWGLQPGIERVHDLAEVEVTEHPGTVWDTMCACNSIYWDEGIGGKVGIIATLGMTMGCSVISGTEPGVIRWCVRYGIPRGGTMYASMNCSTAAGTRTYFNQEVSTC